MISEKQWVKLLPFVNQLCNRESDLTVIAEARITRTHHHRIVLELDPHNLDLEPDPEDVDPNFPRPFAGKLTYGPGWPD